MVIFKLIADIVSNAGILWFTWELVKLMRVLTAPDPDGVERILAGLGQLQGGTQTMSCHLQELVRMPAVMANCAMLETLQSFNRDSRATRVRISEIQAT